MKIQSRAKTSVGTDNRQAAPSTIAGKQIWTLERDFIEEPRKYLRRVYAIPFALISLAQLPKYPAPRENLPAKNSTLNPMKRRATVICERDGRVLLVARVRGRWGFPGGRAKTGEGLADAAVRELKEETGLEAVQVRYAFQFRGFQTRHFVFVASVDPEAQPVPANEIARCKWPRLEALRRIEASVPTRGIAEIFLKHERDRLSATLEESIDAMAVSPGPPTT